jgi:hypothetical protein
MGRWQTRVFLIVFVGVPVSLPFCIIGPLPLIVLAYVLAIGLALDVVYDRKQRSRWDHDWPVHAQVKAGLIEFATLVFVLIGCCGCGALVAPPILAMAPLAAVVVPIHWFTVWSLSFLMLQGPMRVLFPRWRFRGGRIL